MSVNLVILIGRLGKDPRPVGQYGFVFSLATNAYTKDTATGDTLCLL